MATKLYPAASLAGSQNRLNPFGIAGFWEDFSSFWNGLNNHGDFHTSHFKTTKGDGIRNMVGNTADGPVKLVKSGLNISDPVASAFTLSGTVTFNLWASEDSMLANATVIVALFKLDRFGTLTFISEHIFGTELVVGTQTVCNWTDTPTSTDFGVGDHICAVIGATDSTSQTMNAGHNVTVSKAGITDGVDGDTWIEFTENVTFIPEVHPGGTTLHLTNRSESVGEGAMAPRSMSPTRDNSITSYTVNSIAGPLTAPIQWTLDHTLNVKVQWFSKPLRGFTLSGLVAARCPFFIQGEDVIPTNGICMMAELAICDNDGLNAVVWASQLIGIPNLDDTGMGLQSEGQNFSESNPGRVVYLAGPNTVINDGERFRCRIYIVENWTDNSSSPMETGWVAEMKIGNPFGFTVSDGYVRFSQGVYELADTGHEVPAGFFSPELRPEMWF